MSQSFRFGESIETPAQHSEYLRRNEYKYRRYFKDHDSYEVFMMLPLDDKGRTKLLEHLHREEREKLEKCETSERSAQEHLECVQ